MDLLAKAKEEKRLERKRRVVMRNAEYRILCRAFIWRDFHNPELLGTPVPELQAKALQDLNNAIDQCRQLGWRQKRERLGG